MQEEMRLYKKRTEVGHYKGNPKKILKIWPSTSKSYTTKICRCCHCKVILLHFGWLDRSGCEYDSV